MSWFVQKPILSKQLVQTQEFLAQLSKSRNSQREWPFAIVVPFISRRREKFFTFIDTLQVGC